MEELIRLTDNSKDLNEFYSLYLYCFKGKDSEIRQKYFNYRYKHSIKYGIKQRHQLKSGLLSIPLEVNFQGTVYKMNGICDVATYPEFGGYGGITTLMKSAIKEMYDHQTALSYLAPFSYEFYRKFGYEAVFDHCHYSVKSQDFPRIKIDVKTGYVERLDFKAAIPLIKTLYDEAVKNHRGGLIRSDWWWKYLTMKRPDWKVAVYFDKTAKVKGYLIYSEDEQSFKIQDFCSTDLPSYQHLMKFISQHQSMHQIFEYESSCPVADLNILNEPSAIQATVRSYMMARVINLKIFITQYPFVKDVENLKISIEDKILSENNGLWELSVKYGKVNFEKINDNEQERADIQCSIQSLTQAFMGYCSLEHLLKIGKLTGQPTAVARLSKSLIDEKPQIQDYF